MVPHPPLIISEIGKGREKEIEKTINSYNEIAKEIADINPETIIITSPHTRLYNDAFYLLPNKTIKGDLSKFGAGSVSFEEENDLELLDEIEKVCNEEEVSCARKIEMDLDHGSMVPLYFIRKYLPKCKIIVIGFSYLSLVDNYKMGEVIKKAVNNLNRKVVFVASGDLSHKLKEYGPYGFDSDGPIYDEKICNTMKNANFNELLEYEENFLDKAAECGHRSFTIMAGALDSLNVEPIFLSHEDVTGVGYGICKFYPKEENINRNFRIKYLDKIKTDLIDKYNNSDSYIRLAKDSITNYISNKKEIDIPDYVEDKLKNEKKAVFVSIHKFGKLRGCIGTILPTKECIAKEIIDNAINAATLDSRFDVISKDELPFLEINVDELTIPEKTTKDELDPKKYGVIVTSGFKRGLLLPDLDGIDTVEEQIEIAMKKGNISSNDKIELERFEVIRHSL
jgi:AmmeMemoRadiSam system protein A/AmmeMemoRadiSam system protein B